MFHIRKSQDRGYFDFGWLKTHHTFSFGDYFDPLHMGFRSLRVINEDYISKNMGFGTHPHRNMEIITVLIEGELSHQDSMGNGSKIIPGEIQYMSAGSGVTHSEFNSSKTLNAHLLQIWIEPDQKNTPPRYDQKKFLFEKNKFTLLVSKTGEEKSISIHQNIKLYHLFLDENKEVTYEMDPTRFGFVQVVSGEVDVGGNRLQSGDGARVENESNITFVGAKPTELLWFDLL